MQIQRDGRTFTIQARSDVEADGLAAALQKLVEPRTEPSIANGGFIFNYKEDAVFLLFGSGAVNAKNVLWTEIRQGYVEVAFKDVLSAPKRFTPHSSCLRETTG